MADEIRVTNENDIAPAHAPHEHEGEIRAHSDVEGRVPLHDPALVPEDPDAAREAIAHTRARMSETIDEIEDVLVRKRDRIQERLDVLAPVRENPMRAAGAVFGAGLLLGFLTGGDDDHDEARYDAEERADLWETRARRLLRIAQEQESELDGLRHEVLYAVRPYDELEDELEEDVEDVEAEYEDELEDEYEEYEEDYDYDEAPTMMDRAVETAAEKLADLVVTGIRQYFGVTRA